jgi:hypothetical protein
MAMLRAHLMQNWFGYGDPAVEESLYETTIFNFHRLLEKAELVSGVLLVVNRYLGDRGKALWSMRQSFMRPVQPRTRTANAILKCTKPRK